MAYTPPPPPPFPLPSQPDFTDLELASFLLSSPAHPDMPSPSSASTSSTPMFSPNPDRAHPPLCHRRCLFGSSTPATARDPITVSKRPPPVPPNSYIKVASEAPKSRKRGAYNCGKCGLPKRGHVCSNGDAAAPKGLLGTMQQNVHHRPDIHYQGRSTSLADHSSHSIYSNGPATPCSSLTQARLCSETSLPVSSPSLASSCSSNCHYQFTMQPVTAAASDSMDASDVAGVDASIYSDDSSYDLDDGRKEDEDEGAIPLACLVQILSRLWPQDLVAASRVSRRWYQCAEYVWAGIHKANILVKASRSSSEDDADVDMLPYIVRKCCSLQELTLDVTSEIGDHLLRCIAKARVDLASLEVVLKPGGVNSISGEGLRDLLRQCKSLTSLKFEGCHDLVEVDLSSPCLSTLWLNGCQHLKYMFLNCSALSEVCLDLLPHDALDPGQWNNVEKTNNLAAIMKNLGTTARGLTRLHVASPWLHDRVVQALFSSGLKSLRMLSLTFGSSISDHSVAAITSNCGTLELLDLSGSSITDRALELICNTLSGSLSKLLIALCPKVSQVGLHMVGSKLPLLRLLDCGKVMVNVNTCLSEDEEQFVNASCVSTDGSIGVLHLQHLHLQKLSLWGCSELQMLSLDCPSLEDLNLTGCSQLEPDGLQLICPSLKEVYVGNQQQELLHEIHCQMELAACFAQNTMWQRTQPDGSKRVQAPHFSTTSHA